MSREIKFRAWNPFKEIMLNWDYFQISKHLLFNDSYHWLQFTGLTDKNGKEIYEGDICKCDFSNLYNKERGFKVIKWDDVIHGWGLSNDWAKRFEVIGNIYENPELLEVKV